jgi:hypothetical protein
LSRPGISVILSTPGGWQTIALTLRYLRAQTVREGIEVVIVGPDAASIAGAAVLCDRFHSHQLIAVGPVRSIAHANAAGIRAAQAAVVALAEDHCFPEAGWAEALIAAHAGPYAAVGPVVRNANPSTAISWSDFVIGYGAWMEPSDAGPRQFLPGHNSSYKKAALLDYGNDLERWLESETVLHWDLCRRGETLYLEPAARTAHVNFALGRSWFPAQYYNGRVFGSMRAAQWPMAKRIAYGLASPLIPIVRFFRCASALTRAGRPWMILVRSMPALAAGLALDGLGQMMGYMFGAGNAVERAAVYEFHRFRHITEEDRRILQAQAPP